MTRVRLAQTLTLLVALVAAMPGWAQKQSLADRVARLEQQSSTATQSSGQANVDLLNRLTQLQGEVQSLRGVVEQLQNENQQLKDANRAQYLDMDSRLQRLEGGAGTTRPATTPAGTAVPATPVVRPPVRPPVRPMAGGSAPVNTGDEQAAYSTAFDSLKQGDYVASARGFKTYVDTYPQGALAPNAWYWLGESYYVTQNYPLALQSFETLLSQFPTSTKAPDAMLKKGYSQVEMGQVGPGRQTLNQLINDYPGTDASRLADGRLRALGAESR